MAMTVSNSKDRESEQAAAKFPAIRMFKEESPRAGSPQRQGKGKWVICAPETVGSFSAALYFFGREIHRNLGVPVGLLNSSVGGTPIESWIAEEAQRAASELKGFFTGLEKPRPVSAEERQAYEASLAKWEEAVKALEEAFRLDPEDGDTAEGLGELLLTLGKYKEAERPADQATKINPDSTRAWSVLAAARLGRTRLIDNLEI
ncbi:MAG: hypothetical protein EBR18_04010 [Betaproteobacteria bacterium]|nr:hypothetical protein [Betaproteobacteria bacterium]